MELEDQDLLARAQALHRRHLVFDGHCDSILDVASGRRRLAEASTQGHLDFPRALAAGVGAQVFALWPAPEYYARPARRVLSMLAKLQRELAAAPALAAQVTDVAAIHATWQAGRLAVVVGIEGGEALEGDLDLLHICHALGVRVLGLVWNHRNDLADGVAEVETGGGLTAFGRAVVRESGHIGIALDAAHLSPAGFRDLLAVAEAPVLFTHGGCRALFDHPRNLDDTQLKALAGQGGVFGVCFVRSFLGNATAEVTVSTVADHIEHAVAVAGVAAVGLGSDFDGTQTLPDGLPDVTHLTRLTAELLRRGFSDDDLRLILGGNYLRVLASAWKEESPCP